MSRSSARRGQAEPLAALAATAVVGMALAGYVGLLPGAMPGETDRNVAEPAATAAVESMRRGGVVRPDRLSAAAAAAPDGYAANVTVVAADHAWSTGPTPPPSADAATRVAPVRVADGVRPGRVRVVVWT